MPTLRANSNLANNSCGEAYLVVPGQAPWPQQVAPGVSHSLEVVVVVVVVECGALPQRAFLAEVVVVCLAEVVFLAEVVVVFLAEVVLGAPLVEVPEAHCWRTTSLPELSLLRIAWQGFSTGALPQGAPEVLVPEESLPTMALPEETLSEVPLPEGASPLGNAFPIFS